MSDLWLVQPAEEPPFRLLRLGPIRGEVRATIEIPNAFPNDWKLLVVEPDAVWVASGHRFVHRIDPETNGIVAELEVGHHLDALISTPSGLWVTSSEDHGRLVRIDPKTNEAHGTPFQAKYLASTGKDLWVTWMGRVSCVDPATRVVQEVFELGRFVLEIVAGHGGAYALVHGIGESTAIYRLARGCPPRVLVQFGERASSLCIGPDALWLAVPEDESSPAWLTRVALDGDVKRAASNVLPSAVDGGIVWGLRYEPPTKGGGIVRFDETSGEVSRVGAERGTCLAFSDSGER